MLNLVVALQTEANPLIAALKLKRSTHSAYPLFYSASTALIISGMGRNQASAATAWLAATIPASVWLNIGIAGHQRMDIGTALAAHKICEHNTDRCWYPVHIKSPLKTNLLTTFDTVQTDYQDETLHDMEASGFYQTALRFSTAELVHSIKVVSDNTHQPVHSLARENVDELIANNVSIIQNFAQHLCEIAADLQPSVTPELLESFISQWRFSITQQHQLKRLLQRRAALGLSTDPDLLAGDRTLTTGKSVLRTLHKDTDARAGLY